MSNRNAAIELCKQYSLGTKKFYGIQLENADLKKAFLQQIELKRANLDRVNLQQADLSHANFKESSLVRANLSRANLSKADFSNADLSRANLTGANLYLANLSKANLTQTNLSLIRFIPEAIATLEDRGSLVDFRRANLKGAFFIGVDLSNANLSGAIYDDRTQMPVGFSPQSKGMVHIKTMQQFAIGELLSRFNHIYSCSNRYLGKTISRKYFDSSRPELDWLNQFAIDESNQIVYEGSVSSLITSKQLEFFQEWMNSFTKSCSLIVKDFAKRIQT